MHAIAYDEIHDEIVVPQQFAQAILTFRGSANGDEPPVRVIQGRKTQLIRPDRLTVDAVNNELVVPDGGGVLIFPREAHGDVAPVRVLRGPDGRLGDGAVAVDPVGDLFVVAGSARGSGAGGHQLVIFDRTAEGDAKPLRVIRGPRTLLTNTKNVQVIPEGGWILVAEDGVEGSATGLSFVGVWSIHDDGDAPPRWTIGGPRGALLKPRGVAVDPRNRSVIVSDKNLNAVLTYFFPEIF